jgi:hypothetical protein
MYSSSVCLPCFVIEEKERDSMSSEEDYRAFLAKTMSSEEPQHFVRKKKIDHLRASIQGRRTQKESSHPVEEPINGSFFFTTLAKKNSPQSILFSKRDVSASSHLLLPSENEKEYFTSSCYDTGNPHAYSTPSERIASLYTPSCRFLSMKRAKEIAHAIPFMSTPSSPQKKRMSASMTMTAPNAFKLADQLHDTTEEAEEEEEEWNPPLLTDDSNKTRRERSFYWEGKRPEEVMSLQSQQRALFEEEVRRLV